MERPRETARANAGRSRFFISDRLVLLLMTIHIALGFAMLYPFLLWLSPLGILLIGVAVVKERKELKRFRELLLTVSIPKSLELSEGDSLFVSVENPTTHFFQAEILLPTLHEIRWEHSPSAKQTLEGMRVFPFQSEALGTGKIENLVIILRGRWRLVVLRLEYPIPSLQLTIVPSTQPLPAEERQKVREQLSTTLLGARRLTRQRERELFLSLRDYQYPDPIRDIDAKKSAQFQKLTTRLYESTHRQHLIVALDIGRAMGGRVGRSYKQDFYTAGAAHLIQEGLARGDEVSFFSFSDRITSVIPRSRRKDRFRPLLRGQQSYVAQEVETDYSLLIPQIRKLAGSRALIVLLTDLSRPSVQEVLPQVVEPLGQKHLVATCTLLHSELRIEPAVVALSRLDFKAEEYSNLLYRYWVHERLSLLRSHLRRSNASVVAVPEAHWLRTVEYVYASLRGSMQAG
jgi:uncharacterized protein (DUF58 family)